MFDKDLNKKILTQSNIKFGDIKMDKSPTYIKSLCANLKNSNCRDEMYKILDDTVDNVSDFIALDLTTFVGNGYKFQCMLKNNVNPIEVKRIANEAGARVIDIIPIQNSDVCVVVSKAGK